MGGLSLYNLNEDKHSPTFLTNLLRVLVMIPDHIAEDNRVAGSTFNPKNVKNNHRK